MLSKIICRIQKPVAHRRELCTHLRWSLTNGRVEFSMRGRRIGYKI